MYLQCGSGTDNEYASLYTPEEQPMFKKCLQFSYNMHGSDVFILKVFIKTAVGWDDAIWRQNSNQGPNWKTATVPITSFQPFQVRFNKYKTFSVLIYSFSIFAQVNITNPTR